MIDADRLAHEVFRKGNPVYPKVVALFPEIRGRLSRSKVARVVFRMAGKRRELERLVHPYVFRRISEKLKGMRRGVAVVEVPLLFESGYDRRCTRTIVVKADASQVAARLRRKGFTRGEVEARWYAQMPLARKAAKADEVINNSDGLGRTRAQVGRIWKKLNRIERSLLKHVKRKR